ncbi:MAG TPA: response regulator transcription factor [Gemmatimonadaceae bacterium]|nr:response regulator transcription factor [Gemmatimonadaceae bacterium]
MTRVLVIEDSNDLAEGLRYNLELEGYAVKVAEDGNKGLSLAREWDPDLVILDLMLPGIDGYQVLRSLRGDGRQTPVLILSARGEEADKVRGFQLDADQYVTKPFGLIELLERVKSLLRRTRSRSDVAEPAAAGTIRFGDVSIDPASRTVMRAGESVNLTPKAYELMMALIKRKGAVATRVELLREVWDHRAIVLTRTVDSHMAELRKKLEYDAAEPKHFITIWKVGYRFNH